MSKKINLIGKIFGRLVVKGFARNSPNGKAKFFCHCDCGNTTIVFGQCLRRGHTRSCGCWRKESASLKFSTHCRTGTSEYRIWSHIKTRCFNKKSKFYNRYGGRGISMCERWRDSFENFLADMGERPSSRHSIDRIDNNGNYEPQNCRWVTAQTQASNRKTVLIFEHNGITDTMAGWSRRTGIPYLKLRRRIKDGWFFGRAIADAENY